MEYKNVPGMKLLDLHAITWEMRLNKCNGSIICFVLLFDDKFSVVAANCLDGPLPLTVCYLWPRWYCFEQVLKYSLSRIL